MLNDYSDCKSDVEVHEKLKANTNSYFDEEGWQRLKPYGRQYIFPKKPKNIDDLLDEMEKNGSLKLGIYDKLKELVGNVDQRMVENIKEAEKAILKLKIKKERTIADDQWCQGMTDLKKPLDVNQEDVNSLQRKLGDDSEHIEKLITELGSMVKGLLMDEELIDQYNSSIKVISNNKSQFKAIIIAGETCAGKTTLINLLINSNLFEDSNSPSTSAMVFLHYRDKLKIEVYARENRGENLKSKFKDCNISFTTLKRCVNKYTREPTYCVHVFYPAPILKHGIVIVDTPSIGGLEAVKDYFEEKPQQILACIYVMNATCSSWSLSKNGEYIPTFLCELLECVNHSDLLVKGEIIFVINKWETVMTTGEDEEIFEGDAWCDTTHRIKMTLKRHITNHDKYIYKVSLGKMFLEKGERFKRLRREYSIFEDHVYGILEKRNKEILTDLTTIADQCRSKMQKQLKKIKKEKRKQEKCESNLRGNLTKLDNICLSAEIEDSSSDLEERPEKIIKTHKKRKKDLDDQT